MKINLLPKSSLGKWSVGLNAYSVLAFIFGYIFAELLNIVRSEFLITIIGASAIVAAIVALITGLIALRKSKEKSALVFLSIIFGVVVITFIMVSMINDLMLQ